MRRLAGFVIGLALAPGVAAAQTVSFALGADSVLSVLTGATRTIQLQVSGTGGVSAYNITILLDRSRVDISAADTVPGGYGLPIPTRVLGTDSVVLSASGSGSTTSIVPIANLTFSVGAGVTQGSLVSLRVNSLTLGDQATSGLPGHRTGILNVCQATSMRGDPSGDRVVNSRDALIALTAAVGLPATGFDVAAGDADGDGRVTSRDALYILSYGIGIFTGLPDLGWGIPNACAPLTVAPDSLLFFRSGSLYQIAKNDSTPTRLPLTPYAYYYPARWSPDGDSILYTGNAGIVVANAAGTVLDTLTPGIYWDAGADWSPDGASIAFVSNRSTPSSVWLMDANGANPVQLTTTVTVNVNSPVAWSPDGTRLAFAGCQTCVSDGLWVVNRDGSGLLQVVPESAGQYPQEPQWTPAGDSLYYFASSSGYVRVVPVAAGDTGQVAVRLDGNAYHPAVSPAGKGFQSSVDYPYDFFLRRATDGRYLRLVRGDATNSDGFFAFRRSGGVYVDTVTVSPAGPVQLSVSTNPTQQFTATVSNSDGSTSSAPVTWVSRDPAKLSVTTAGLVTAVDTSATGRYIVATTGGWRSDSVLVTVTP